MLLLITIPFGSYNAITRRTITTFHYQICGAFVIGFSVGFVSVIVNPNVKEEYIESIETIGVLIGSTLLLKND